MEEAQRRGCPRIFQRILGVQVTAIAYSNPTDFDVSATFYQKQQQESWAFTEEVIWLPKYPSSFSQTEIWFSILQPKLITSSYCPDLNTSPILLSVTTSVPNPLDDHIQ
ncbi:MAG: hypothetical protein PUP93_00150 [Rhizonema sp. NSF051]|nr:hypothetical protein [Rhizonema sp. NSF051]